jgi:hypothetical protein
VNTAALSRNPSRTAAVFKAAAGLRTLISRTIVWRVKTGKDRRMLQSVPAYLLADMGLERMEIRTTAGSEEVWFAHRRY